MLNGMTCQIEYIILYNLSKNVKKRQRYTLCEKYCNHTTIGIQFHNFILNRLVLVTIMFTLFAFV